jgi:hypothetical protein
VKTIPNAYSLQPDGYDPEDLAPKVCARCGHFDYQHECIGYDFEGACESCNSCPAFALFIDEED